MNETRTVVAECLDDYCRQCRGDMEREGEEYNGCFGKPSCGCPCHDVREVTR